jgi:hypothetical protein
LAAAQFTPAQQLTPPKHNFFATGIVFVGNADHLIGVFVFDGRPCATPVIPRRDNLVPTRNLQLKCFAFLRVRFFPEIFFSPHFRLLTFHILPLC